ncbi:MAG: regulatory protein RecX [Pseudohongiellaceae bacterium]|nr:regulatory protein RecX [Pseudohongiellaceae bacterium]
MEDVKPSEESLRVTLRRFSMDLLARREHSRAELAEKLMRKHGEYKHLFDQVLDQLESDNLLSDERFAEAYVRYRQNKGFGPLMLQQELRIKGVSDQLIASYVQAASSHWQDILDQVIVKKRRLSNPAHDKEAERKQQQKLYRFCLSRGFPADMVSKALFRS